MNEFEGQILQIPIRGSEEVVEVKLDELPDDPADIIDIMKAEFAPLDLWLQFAIFYYKQNNINAFKMILSEGADPALETIYPESKKERIAIINTLAAYYTNLAMKQKEKPKRDELFNQATMNYNKADKIEIREEMTWVGKGVLLLCKQDVSRASDCFDNALKANPKNAPALLGKACIFFNKGQIEEALKNYKEVLNNVPNAPANVRLGLANCYYKLNKMELARKSFERVLDLDENNVEALVGIAILDMNTEVTGNSQNKQQLQIKAMNNIKKAYEVNPNNSMVLNHLANHFFYRQDYKKVQTLALNAYHNTEVNKIRAESCYQIARSYHVLGEYDNAFKYYFQATHNWPEYTLAQFGLGQLYLHKEEFTKAIQSFELVLRYFPDNFETLRVLGSLYFKLNKKDKAYTYIKRATELRPDDVETWIELAQLYEDNYKEALEAYEKSLSVAEKKASLNEEFKVTSELYNNVAVLRHLLGKYDEAEKSYLKAIEVTGHDIKEYKTNNVTTTYNYARLQESKCNYEYAEEIYKGILKEHPNYIDCYLRLGCMARASGQIYEASVWFKDVFTVNDKNLDAWCLLGNLHLQKEEWLPAQKTFERIIEQSRTDPYAHLSLGNIYYAAKFEKKERQEKYLKLSMDFYWKVLQSDPSNIYAANGVGVYFAEKGNLNEARDFFIQVREATGDMPDVWINLAHVYVAQGLYLNAIKLYQNCLKKFYNNKDSTILLFLARAFYEAERYEDCKSTLLKAIHLAPHSKSLWFNLGLAEEQYGSHILKQEKKIVSLSEMRKVVNSLRQAVSVFGRLKDNSGTGGAFIGVRAEKHANYCQSLLDIAAKKLTSAEEIERINRLRQEESQMMTEQMRINKEREEEQKMQAEIEKKQEEEEAAREIEAKLSSLTNKWSASQPSKGDDDEGSSSKKKKRRNKEKDSFINDNELYERPEEEDMTPAALEERRARSLKELGERHKRDKKKKKRKTSDEDVSEDGDDSEKKKKKKKKKKRSKQKEQDQDDDQGQSSNENDNEEMDTTATQPVDNADNELDEALGEFDL